MNSQQLDAKRIMISEARHHDPFAVLEHHERDGSTVMRTFMPYSAEVLIAESSIHPTGG